MFAFDDLRNALFLMVLPTFVVLGVLWEGMKHSAISRVRNITTRLLTEDREVFWQQMAVAELVVLYAPAGYWPGTYVSWPTSALTQEQDVAEQLSALVGASIYNTFWPRGTAAEADFAVSQIRLRDRQRQHAAAVRLARESEDFPVPCSPNTRETQAEGGMTSDTYLLCLTGAKSVIRALMDSVPQGITHGGLYYEPEEQQGRLLIKAETHKALEQFDRLIKSRGIEPKWKGLHSGQHPKQLHHYER
jgi:hypothetical protein